MPPLPKSATARSGSGTQSPRTRAGGGSGRESSSTPPPPTSPPRGRATKTENLGIRVARMYTMLGTVLVPMGRFYPALGPLGNNLKSMSDEAAEAWIELAEQDKKVKEILESMTGASLWGNVIGVHFAIFSAVIPGGEVIQGAMTGEVDLAAMFSQMSPEEQAAAQALAAEMMGAGPIPTRDRSSGGPGDTVQAAPAPQFDPSAQPVQQQAPSAAAIVTPEAMGVVNPGEQGGHPFPADPSGPNGRA